MQAECNLMIRRFILTHFPRAIARLGFNHVNFKGLFSFSGFPLCGLCKLENHAVVVNLREVFLLTHRWEMFPGAPCVCWLLFQTISTSLIILISRFYAWIPLFSRSPPDFFPPRLFSSTLCLTEGYTMHLHKIASNVYICIVMTRKSLWWKQNNWTGWLPLCAGNRSDFLFQESRDSWPHRYSSTRC